MKKKIIGVLFLALLVVGIVSAGTLKSIDIVLTPDAHTKLTNKSLENDLTEIEMAQEIVESKLMEEVLNDLKVEAARGYGRVIATNDVDKIQNMITCQDAIEPIPEPELLELLK